MLAEARSASKSPSTPPTVEPATPTMLLPADAQAAAVIPMLPAAVRLNICRRSRTPSWGRTQSTGTSARSHGTHRAGLSSPDDTPRNDRYPATSNAESRGRNTPGASV